MSILKSCHMLSSTYSRGLSNAVLRGAEAHLSPQARRNPTHGHGSGLKQHRATDLVGIKY